MSSKSTQPRVMWSGAAFDPSGYGEATRNYMLGLHYAGRAHIHLLNRQFFAGDMPDLGGWLPAIVDIDKKGFDLREPHLAIQHLTPENYFISGGGCKYHVGMTTFETDSIPNGWQVPMRSMDELWTHSHWGKQIFESVGIRRPIKVMPHGVDTDRFRPDVEPLDEMAQLRSEGRFVFGANFDWNPRKNPTALLNAYLQEFGPEDDVVLVIKSYHQYPISQSMDRIRSEVNSARVRLGKDASNSAPIVVVGDIMPAALMPRWYAGLDAYVVPSRGEGWGLSYTEAMSTGLPTIAVAWSGHTEFMNARNSVLINDFKLVPAQVSDRGAMAPYAGHRWADVDVDSLASHMRQVREGGEEIRKIAARARKDMVEKWSWSRAIGVMANRVDEIAAFM